MPRPFGCGAIPPGRTQRLLDSVEPSLSRVPTAGGLPSSRLSPQIAGASPLRLACAAGLFRLAVRPGVTRDEWLGFPPAGWHCCLPAGSASPGTAFAFPDEGTPPSGPFGPSVPPDPPS